MIAAGDLLTAMTVLETIPGASDSGSSDSFDASAEATRTLADTRAEGHAAGPAPTLERGQNIGRYLVIERLGAGAMGVVFAAYDPELDRRVAIKVLHARYQGERAQARLVREAQALARVTHPHVVAVHDVGVHEQRVFLAMQYVEGQTLRGYLADPSHTLAERLALLARAGEGLAAAHRAGLVHRDFKPDNVMIGARGEVKVMDFGLARSQASDASSDVDWTSSIEGASALSSAPASRLAAPDLTQAGAMIGTPAYMAPEQLAGLAADARSDQFAFAVTLYEALYGVRPFVGANLSALALAISEGRIADPPKHHRVPPWLRRVVLRGLASNPSERWPDLDEFVRALAHDPLRTRRRRLFGGSALGLSAVGGALIAWLVASPSAPARACSELGQGIEGRWGEDQRATLERTLGQDSITRASTTTLLETLDAYAEAWDRTNHANCAASEIDHSQTPRVHDLRVACLRHRKIAFEELVRALGERRGPSSESKAQVWAVEASARLPAIEVCSDIAALELEPALPTDPERRAEVEQLRDDFAALEPSIALGTTRAVERARALAARAEATDDPPVRAEAALVLGRTLAATDTLPEAVEQLRQAYFLAMSCGHVRTQAEAAIALVYAVGYLQQSHAQGLEWAEHALAIVARFGEGGLIEAEAQHTLGVVLDAVGEHAASLIANQRAFEIRRALLPAIHPDLARSLNALGNLHHTLGQLERAREDHEQALAMRIELFGPDHPILVGSLNNLALALRDLGQLEAAKRALERAVALVERSGGPTHNGLARPLTNLADIERRLHHPARARELAERALTIRRANVGDLHPEVADSIVALAEIAIDEGELERAETLALDGLARLRRDFAPGHPEIFAATLVLASVLEADARPDEAARVLVAALAESRVEELEAADLEGAKALLERVGSDTSAPLESTP